MWIGFNDFALDGTMEWSSGVPVTYENWYPGEPSNLDFDFDGENYVEHCVLMYANINYTWWDTTCAEFDKHHFVCSTH